MLAERHRAVFEQVVVAALEQRGWRHGGTSAETRKNEKRKALAAGYSIIPACSLGGNDTAMDGKRHSHRLQMSDDEQTGVCGGSYVASNLKSTNASEDIPINDSTLDWREFACCSSARIPIISGPFLPSHPLPRSSA